MNSMARSLAMCMVLALAACGGGGGGGGGAPAAPPPGGGVPTASGNEGSLQSPVAVAIGSPRSSSVSVLTDSFYTFTTSSADTYRIALTNPNADVSWKLYSDAGFATEVATCDNVFGATAAETCYVNLTANASYYLRVRGFTMSLSSITYTLEVKAILAEGTAAAPVDLSVDAAVRPGSVSLAGASYYRFLTGSTGAYSVGITNSRGALFSTATQIEVYASPLTDASPVLVKRCSLTSNPSCTANGLAANAYHYVKILGSGSSAVEYDISVTTGVSEGSVAAPVDLTMGAQPRTAAVDGYGARSFYRFTTGALGGEYLLSVLNTTGSLAVGVFTDALFQNVLSSTYCSTSASCKLTLEPLTSYYVMVSNQASVDLSYQIAVARGLTEGTPANPITLTPAAPAHSAVIDASGTAYYVFTTTSFAGSYTVALTGTQKDLNWQVWRDSTDYFRRVNFTCDKITTAGPGDETCSTPNLEPNTTYTLKISNKEASGPSPYNIVVTAGGGSEGHYYVPLQLTGLTRTGSVRAGGYSYYSFTTGAKALTYMISVSNMQSNLDWSISATSFAATPFLSCNNYANGVDTSAETCATSDRFSNVSVLAANTSYYLRVANTQAYTSAVDSTFDLTLTPLDPVAGCDAAATQCFNFEDGIFPAAFVQTSNTTGQQWKWKIDSVSTAGTGANTIRTGSLNYPDGACFSYAPAFNPPYVAFSISRDSGNSVSFTARDASGTIWGSYYPSDSGVGTGWRRVRIDTSKITGAMTLQWCVSKNSTVAVGSDIIWLDDIELK
jgi:hypothetical protein